MRYAIDRYRIGKEEEVCADDFYSVSYIPQRKTRFYCPECGEPVFWRSRGGTQPDKFCHYTKTDRSPECDRRVDGHSGLSLYERIGLPLYLFKHEDQFQLTIGFPSVGERNLIRASSLQTRVIISAGEKERIIYVNQTNFVDCSITTIPVDFVPHFGENYQIAIEPFVASYELQQKWSNYADGFECGGSLFSYEESGGKKIRRGDSISPGREYYLISKGFSPRYEEISVKTIGSIKLNDSMYSVYQMSVNVAASNESRYGIINNYLKSQFGVWLVEIAPELTPLWPPVVFQDDMIPVIRSTNIYCGVSSGNDSPTVFTYSGSSVSQMVVHRQNNAFTVVIPMYAESSTLSVDRKYVGREMTFCKRPVKASNFEYQLMLAKADDSVIPFSALTEKELADDFTVMSNSKMELYVGSRDKTYQHIILKEPTTIVAKRRKSQELFFVVENAVTSYFRAIGSIGSTVFDEQQIVIAIHRHNKGLAVPAPRWIIEVMMKYREAGCLLIADEIKSHIVNGKIRVGVLSFFTHNEHIRVES